MCGLGVDGILTRHALLQQAHARTASTATSSPSPMPPPARSASTTSPAARPSTSLPGHRAPPGRAREHRGHQGGERRPAPDHGDHPRSARTRFAVLSGDDWLAFPVVAGGRRRADLAWSSNEVPAQMTALVRHALAGELEAARECQYRLLPLMDANFLETNPTPVKAGARRDGQDPRTCSAFRWCPPSPATRGRAGRALGRSRRRADVR